MHNFVDTSRAIWSCALIFMVCAGLGTAGFWATTRTEEIYTRREIMMVVRALAVSAASALALLWVVPHRLAFAVTVFFTIYAIVVTIMLAILHWRINKSLKEVE